MTFPSDALAFPFDDSASVALDRPDKPEEACGVFGLFAPEEDVARLAYFGLFALQHRGQESAGIATFDASGCHHYKHMGLVSQVFDDHILKDLPGHISVGHTRYSTTGSSHVCNAQPAVIPTRLGDLALAHNGNLVNADDLRVELLERNHDLVTTTDSEMIAFALAEAVNDGLDWMGAAEKAFNRCQGAFSLVIGTPDGIIGARDHQGIRPLVLGVMGREIPAEGSPAPMCWPPRAAPSTSLGPPTFATFSRASWCGLPSGASAPTNGPKRPSASFVSLR